MSLSYADASKQAKIAECSFLIILIDIFTIASSKAVFVTFISALS